MKTSLLRIGNSQGVIIPKPLLMQAGLEREVDLKLDGDSIIISRPKPVVRKGWAKASASIVEHGDDALVLGDFENSADAEVEW